MATIPISAMTDSVTAQATDIFPIVRGGANFKSAISYVKTFFGLPFVVGPGTQYMTIQSAINAAALVATSTTPQVVLINPGTYNENLVLKDFVNLASFAGVSTNSVLVVGNAVYTPTINDSNFSASGIEFITPAGGGDAFSIAGANSTSVDLNGCGFTATIGTAFSCSNANAITLMFNVICNASAGQKIFNLSAGQVTALSSQITSVDTPSTISDTAFLILFSSIVIDSYVLTGTSMLAARGSVITSLGVLSIFDIGPTSFVILPSLTTISSHPSYWATGTGTILYNSVTGLPFGSGLSVDPALATIPLTLLCGKISFNGGLNTFVTAGNFDVIQTYTATTNVTFPISGTLATVSQLPVLPLSLANGGTGANLIANNGGIFYSTAATGSISAGTATANQVLLSGSFAAPVWSAATYPASTITNQILYSSATNTISGISTGNNSVLATNGAGVPGMTTSLPAAVQVGVNSLNNGTGASPTTFWRGDGSWAAPADSGISSVVTQVFPLNAIYTPTAGMQYCIIEVIGAGGGGGGSTGGGAGVSAAGGGGAGGYAKRTVSAAQVGASATILVSGAGGSGGAPGNNGGSIGNASSITLTGTGSIVITAIGGSGGQGAANSQSSQDAYGAGGIGGSASNGDISIEGQPGFSGIAIYIANDNVYIVSGTGGSSPYGAGGKSNNNTGNNGTGYGSGGSGAASRNDDHAGGNGAGGLVLITEFIA